MIFIQWKYFVYLQIARYIPVCPTYGEQDEATTDDLVEKQEKLLNIDTDSNPNMFNVEDSNC